METTPHGLLGIGLYTPHEAGRLLQLPSARILRWLGGYSQNGKHYEPLWAPQVNLGDEGIFLGFRDLQEARVAAAFVAKGLSLQRVRQAIELARIVVCEERPLSTTRFRTDGRSVFLQLIEEDGQTRLIDLFKKQFAFKDVIERSLTNLDYDDGGAPSMWWPIGRDKSIVIDPTRSFGKPIEAETSVPVDSLITAVRAEGSEAAAARSWDVPIRAVRRALVFQREMDSRQAA